MRARPFSMGGLPVAAYLGLLAALALAAAFIAVLAIVIWLPPRPPDVMRADIVAAHFQAGYDHMRTLGRPIPSDVMAWSVKDGPPRALDLPAMNETRTQLAEDLDLTPEQVRVAAARIMQSDVFVFRVNEGEARRMHQDHIIAADHAEVERHRAEIERRFELRIPLPPPHQPDAATPVPLSADETPGAQETVASVLPVTPVPPMPPMPPTPVFAPAPPGVALVSGFEIGAQLPDGRWLVMRQGRNWAEIGWIGRAALIIGGTLLVLSLLAILFARRLTRPIRNFSDAVQAVGVDPQSEPVREEGPRELRGAARAVNTMQARLRALIADRTKTLAAVAHDMRTPLMRLRLAAENAPPEQREKMAKEIGEVEALVASFIAFARDDPAEEARVRLDLGALLQSIADDQAEAGKSVTFDGGERVVITGQSLGLKRLFANLVENALKYGASARIRLSLADGHLIVDVEDDGPGVPADRRESVFEPFVRLNEEGARGAGLGLAAARSIARAHGGDVVILDAARGALVRVTLPA